MKNKLLKIIKNNDLLLLNFGLLVILVKILKKGVIHLKIINLKK